MAATIISNSQLLLQEPGAVGRLVYEKGYD